MTTASSLDAPRASLASSWRVLIADRLFLSALIASLIGGIANSATAPQLSLFLTKDLGASDAVAGWYYLTNLTVPIAGLIVGARSDRGSRPWFWYRISGAITAVGWFAVAAAQQLWVPFVASTVLLAFGGAVGGQLFAGVRHRLSAMEEGRTIGSDTSTQVMALIRMAMTAGWIIGPLLGSWLGGVVGLRTVIVVSGVGLLIQVLVMFREKDHRVADHGVSDLVIADETIAVEDPTEADHLVQDVAPTVTERIKPSMLAVVVFTVMCVITLSGNTLKYAYLPIYLNDYLHSSDTLRGAVIGSQQIVELSLMPVSAVLAARFGAIRVVAGGALAAMLAHLCFVLGPNVGWMFAGQVLLGVMWSAIAALGLPVALQLAGTRVGLTSGLFMSSSAVASALGGLMGGVAVAALGLPGIFWVPAVLCAFAVVGLLVLDRRYRALR